MIGLGHSPRVATSPAGHVHQALGAARFEKMAGVKLREVFGSVLTPGSLAGVPKRFDFVSPDGRIVGDAKYYTLVS